MEANESSSVKALDLGRDLFSDIVQPTMERTCPDLLVQATCGRFGWGSECLGLDDSISRDHHWGPSIDILLPEDFLADLDPKVWTDLGQNLPNEFRGFPLISGPVGAGGLTVESRESFLRRTIGRTTSPETWADWLEIPEEDIVHVINGEVWHDPPGAFTAIRETLGGYYPDEVWRRRIAHWCRYASGMGLYALNRALLRENWPYVYWTFARTLKLTLELAFLLNRTYFPYDKWLYPLFRNLPYLAEEMDPLVVEAMKPETGWERRCELFEGMHDLLDSRMMELELVDSHPRFTRSETSGYRVLEHDYQAILKTIPDEILNHTPLCDQRYFEGFVSKLVAGYSVEQWQGMLKLETHASKSDE